MSRPILYQTIKIPDRQLNNVEAHIFEFWIPGGNNLFSAHQIADRTKTNVRRVRRVISRLVKEDSVKVFWTPKKDGN